jgi:hypothetical protein
MGRIANRSSEQTNEQPRFEIHEVQHALILTNTNQKTQLNASADQVTMAPMVTAVAV